VFGMIVSKGGAGNGKMAASSWRLMFLADQIHCQRGNAAANG
jgi:hypothetical protein